MPVVRNASTARRSVIVAAAWVIAVAATTSLGVAGMRAAADDGGRAIVISQADALALATNTGPSASVGSALPPQSMDGGATGPAVGSAEASAAPSSPGDASEPAGDDSAEPGVGPGVVAGGTPDGWGGRDSRGREGSTSRPSNSSPGSRPTSSATRSGASPTATVTALTVPGGVLNVSCASGRPKLESFESRDGWGKEETEQEDEGLVVKLRRGEAETKITVVCKGGKAQIVAADGGHDRD